MQSLTDEKSRSTTGDIGNIVVQSNNKNWKAKPQQLLSRKKIEDSITKAESRLLSYEDMMAVVNDVTIVALQACHAAAERDRQPIPSTIR